jgi:hypothetical protein
MHGPRLPPRPHFLGDKRQNGANSLSIVDSATSMALFAEAAPAAVKSP